MQRGLKSSLGQPRLGVQRGFPPGASAEALGIQGKLHIGAGEPTFLCCCPVPGILMGFACFPRTMLSPEPHPSPTQGGRCHVGTHTASTDPGWGSPGAGGLARHSLPPSGGWELGTGEWAVVGPGRPSQGAEWGSATPWLCCPGPATNAFSFPALEWD